MNFHKYWLFLQLVYDFFSNLFCWLKNQRNVSITFRLSKVVKPSKKSPNIDTRAKGSKENFQDAGKEKIDYQYAGTINIEKKESGIELYEHQNDAVKKLDEMLLKSNETPFEGLLVLPTGGGKTLTAAYWLAKNVLSKGKKILWIAHRHELLTQAMATFNERLAFKDIMGSKTSFDYRIISGIHDKPVNIKPTDDIIVSSKDSLANKGFEYLSEKWLKKNDEVFLVVDEAHHATAKTYRELIDKIKKSVKGFRMLGLTATPFRTADNEQGLLKKIFRDDIVFKINLTTLITRGILSEPIFEEVSTSFDMTKELSDKQLEKLRYLDIGELGEATIKTIAVNNERNSVIINQYIKNKSKYNQAIVFAINQDNAIALNKLFEKVCKSEYVIAGAKDLITGATNKGENAEKINRFRKGELDVLVNVNILTEGVDLPQVQTIFLARPTNSTILMTQMIGRGLRGKGSGGTEEAYIVSFIDNWHDKISWVNPEKLFIEENIDFNDKKAKNQEYITRLISIKKIEEFALLANELIDKETKDELERLNFIERIPLGVYYFSIIELAGIDGESDRNCEVLVYDNLRQSYLDFVNSLPDFFKEQKLDGKENLYEAELGLLASKVDNDFFYGCEKYPSYHIQDIKNILQFYAQKNKIPDYVEFKNRENYNIDKVAKEILDKNLGRKEEEIFKNSRWESNEIYWKAFFGKDKKYFLNEIDLAIRKIQNPELYEKSTVLPTDTKEKRALEKLSMGEIREKHPRYWKKLSDAVYAKYTDEDGNYYSALSGKSGFKSKNKLKFQIDHIKAFSEGGPTTFDNLRLLTIRENAKKGSK